MEQASNLVKDIDFVLNTGGFKVKQWIISGAQQVTDKSMEIADISEGSALGIRWRPKEDIFTFKYDSIKVPSILTRRSVLSLLSSVYDPLGLLIPFTLQAKLIMREISNMKNEWDKPISFELRMKCVKYINEIEKLQDVQFNRCVKPQSAVGDPILVIYCDASELAYGACAYIRWKLDNLTVYSYLMCQKPFGSITSYNNT